jgi:hypothetical protein
MLHQNSNKLAFKGHFQLVTQTVDRNLRNYVHEIQLHKYTAKLYRMFCIGFAKLKDVIT